jgi:serine/threonine protein kinase
MHKDLVTDLLKECAKMKEFNHPNVLTLIGVCLDGGPAPYIVMPFMEKGSLLSYLREERRNLVLDSTVSEENVSYLVQHKAYRTCHAQAYTHRV